MLLPQPSVYRLEHGPSVASGSACLWHRHDMMSERILIVGAGPTGLTAALELSRLAIPVRIIDKRAAPLTTSRAVGVQARTLELLEQRGLSEEMVRLGNPATGGSVYGGGKRMLRLDFTRIESRY